MSTNAHQQREPSDAACDVLAVLASGAAAPQLSARLVGVARPLDDRSRALAGLVALLATGAPSSAYDRLVADALAAGLSAEEIVDVLIVVAATVGLARLVPAAIELASALGYDVDRALEVREAVHGAD